MTSAPFPAANFVFVGIQSWDLPLGGNAKDIALELSKTQRVLYVSPPPDRITRFRAPARPSLPGHRHRFGHLRQISDTLWVLSPGVTLESINWLPDSRLFDRLNRLNNQRLARNIRWATDQLRFDRFSVVNDGDMFRSFYLKELLRPDQYVYYTRDNLLGVEYWQKHGQRLEPLLMRKADMVVSNSPYLARVAGQYNPQSVYIGQGCDLSLFDAARVGTLPCPADLASVARPRIGYVGALNSRRLAIDWLESVARQRPQWNIVLVGPEDDEFRTSSLHALPNVHFLGAKPLRDLPAYLHGIDVTMNPQQLNNLTIGNYPRKIDEYLAMGKPVVALRTEAMSIFRDHVILTDTLTEFIAGIERALREPAPGERGIAFARRHTWAHTVLALQRAMADSLLPELPRPTSAASVQWPVADS